MVKIGRKFFFNQTFRRKKRIKTIIIIAAVIIAVIVATILFFANKVTIIPIEKKTSYKLKDSITVELYGNMPSVLDYFEYVENIPVSELSISYNKAFVYEEDTSSCTEEQKELIEKIKNKEIEDDGKTDYFACVKMIPTQTGNYEVTIKVKDETLTSSLNVIDQEKPKLILKDVTITEEQKYDINDFVKECSDNSGDSCNVSYYEGEEDIDYSSYKEPGEYEIKIIAYDKSGNKTDPEIAKLTIKDIKYYTVTFNSNGGNKVENQTVKEGTKAYSTLPVKSGYTFLGWYDENNYKFNFNNPIARDITLTAKWEKKQENNNNNNQNNNNNNQNNNNNNQNNNNNNNTGCAYGKYSDYKGTISMYATQINGRKISDCASPTGSATEYNKLYGYAVDITNNLARKGSPLDQEIRQVKGTSANIYFDSHVSYIVNSSNGFVGTLITIKVMVNNEYYKTYTLYNCSTTSCEWY